MKAFPSALQLVGNTPLISLNRIKKELGLKSNIYAKIEAFNPVGSSKDRIALKIIEACKKEGRINELNDIMMVDTFLCLPSLYHFIKRCFFYINIFTVANARGIVIAPII